ncbi:MAG: M28 family peptidase [Phycisphaera sp.]|nr:MAG: M28 family peptidase [Phycisphaera sp.]
MTKFISAAAALALACLPTLAQDCPIAEALAASDAEVRLFDTHVTTLSSPAMGGRLPGSKGMAMAKDYVQRSLELAGLEPAFGSGESASWRQSFSIENTNAENVAGLIRGSGDLASQYIVIGAHLDHLGDGQFGSRGETGSLHPGADDNASGVAGMLLMARGLAGDYAKLDGDRRSVLFIAFSGEESGLNGATFYVNNPVSPITTHTLMINFDMIGRIKDGRLSVSGVGTGVGLEDVVEPIFDASPLIEQVESGLSGRSDHWAFYEAGVPGLFVTATDQHDDYHTQNDESWKINRTQGAETAAVFAQVVHALATTTSNMAFVGGQRPAAGPSMGDIRVRFGIRPGSYVEGVSGVAVGGVTPDSPADHAGLESGDRLVGWNGQAVGDVRDWMGQLMRHDPGDVVTVTVERDGERIDFKVTLQDRGGV